jgi:hypothetical protein
LDSHFLLDLGLRSGQLLTNRAYLDPGSGSFILQLILASLLGLGFIIKAYWKKLVGLFRRRSDETQDPDDE